MTLNKVFQLLKDQNLKVVSLLLVTAQTLKTSAKGAHLMICTLSP